MKRGSFVGPLILILIGVIFLLKNIRPELQLFELFMTYWPFLLIGWGALRLLEILVIHFRGGTLPATGVSGGEWALIVILSIVGSSVWGVQRLAHDGLGRFRVGGIEVFGETYDYGVDAATAKAPKTVRVVIDNARGNTRVVGADIEEVKVSGRKTIRAMSRGEADRANEKAQVEIHAAGDVVTVNCNQDRADGPRISTDLEVTVPKGASVETRGRYGDVEVTEVAGDVTVNSDNAGVRLQNIGGRVRMDTRKSDILRAVDVKGDVELKGRGRDIELENIGGQVTVNGSYSGETSMRKLAKPVRFESAVTEFRMERIPGELQLSLSTLTGTNLVGPLVVKARSKDIRLTDVTESVELDIDRGDVELRQPKAVTKMDVKVRAGDIEVALPQQAKFTVNASTERGGVNNDFDQKLKLTTEGNGGKLAGTLGPGPEVRLSTSRGELTLRKMGAAETGPAEPPAPPKPALPAVPPRADNQ
ncbi:MAG: DUF4097 family beta strand repeat protein [Acidobacteria bacterium]|nr:DUF4097 family beta strand repeat protein [Acidobacteriota bacterium]